jgi:hypothetical protein
MTVAVAAPLIPVIGWLVFMATAGRRWPVAAPAGEVR